jgi:DNA-binding transcriptional ArsR family regulator
MDEVLGLTRFYKALGDETRLRLVQLLARQEPSSALCVGRLAQESEVSSSTVSQHLRVLKDLGLVRAELRGDLIHYYLDERSLAAYQDLVRERLGEAFAASIGTSAADEEARSVCCCYPKAQRDHPERPKGDAGECTPEEIRECHGGLAEHSRACEGAGEKE